MSSQLLKNARTLHNAVLTACEKHFTEASHQLDRARQAEELPAMVLHQGIADGAALSQAFARFEVAQGVLDQETAQDTDARVARDETAEELYSVLVRLGALVTSTYSRDFTSRLSLTGTTPRTVGALLGYAQGFLGATSPIPEPPSTDTWTSLDLTGARAEVEALTGKLKQRQLEVSREVRESQASRLQRDQAHAEWYRELRFHVDLLRAVLKRAGQDELADRILPTERQFQDVQPLIDDTNPSSPEE